MIDFRTGININGVAFGGAIDDSVPTSKLISTHTVFKDRNESTIRLTGNIIASDIANKTNELGHHNEFRYHNNFIRSANISGVTDKSKSIVPNTIDLTAP